MVNNLREKIDIDFENIEKTIAQIDLIFQRKQIENIELTALGGYLQNVYRAIENIIYLLLKNKEIKLTKDEEWHNKIIPISFTFLLITLSLYHFTTAVYADFTINAGSATFNSCSFRISGGSITVNAGGTLNCAAAQLYLSGDWKNNGAFNAGTSTVTFEDGNTSSTLSGSTSFYCFGCTAIAKAIYFTALSTQTVTEKLTLTGSAGNLISLRSTTAGYKWFISLNKSQTANYVDVQDSDALNNTVTCGNSVDSGNNNANWIFDNTAPAGISDLTALKAAADGTVKLEWTSPGDDGTVGTINNGEFRIKYSTVGIITAANFDSPPTNMAVTTVNISTSGVVPLSAISYQLSAIVAGATYYFAIKTQDDAGNWSVWNSKDDPPIGGQNNAAYLYIPSVVKSVASGNWDNSGTWELNAIPWASQQVQIQSGHTATFNRNDTSVTCSTLTIYGTLQFDGAVDTRTMVVAGNIDIQNGGKLLMPPNTGYISALKIKCPNSEGEFGIIVNNGGIFDVQGNTTTTPSTRNCLIASINVSSKTYIRNLSQTEANFNLYYVEVSSVGVNADGKYGITFDGSGTRGKINYCSIHNGYYGIFLNQSSSNTINNNSYYSNSSDGIYLNNSSNNTIVNNSCYSNNFYGICLINSSNNTISNNSCCSNGESGIYLEGSSNNTISNNSCYSNADGIYLDHSSNNIISNNSCYSNTNYGIYLYNSSSNTISNNSCYSNSNYGIYTYNSINNTVINCELGKSGNNTNGDIGYVSGSVSKLTLKDCNLYSTTKVNTSGIDTAGSYLVSYNQDGLSGNTKIWGDYKVISGQVVKCNYGEPLYISTATKPNSTLKGTGSISYPVTVDSMTVTELWEVKCVGDPNFEVKRSSAIGAAFILDGTATEGSAYTSTARGVSFTIGSDAYSVDDVFYFVTISSSNDQNVQKKIEFYDTPVGTKLTIDNGGEIQMLGTQAYPTISTSAASNYYGFYASGTINASNYQFSNLTSSGVVIVPGANVVDLSSGTFDTIQASEDSSYIRVTGITSNATFYSCVFNDTPGTANYNIKADGSGINWTFRKWSGVKAGEDYDYDGIGSTVTWPDPLSVDITELSFNFGIVPFGGSVISASSATIANNGEVNATYQIKLLAPPTWTASTTAGVDQFVFYVIVSSATPIVSDFGTEDIVSTTAQACTATVFAGQGTQNGVNVPPGEKRYMWARFLAPTKTTTETQQGITITLTPVSP